MTKGIKFPRKLHSTHGRHSDNEAKAMESLYTQTSVYSKSALFGNPLTELEKRKKNWNLYRLHESRKALLDIKEIANKRKGIPVKLSYYADELAKTNPASFIFLTDAQKLDLKNRLIHTYFLRYSLYQLDCQEERDYALKGHHDFLDLCSKRIEQLDHSAKFGEPISPEKQLEEEISWFTKCLGYLGITLFARWFLEKIDQLIESPTRAINSWIGEINSKRLYWVWTGGLLSTVFAALPKTFFNSGNAGKAVDSISPIGGYLSWILYFFRLGINVGLLIKHTFFPGAEESQIPIWERFKTQAKQRKFAILNDLIWGPINFVCFFFLTGTGYPGYSGNVANVVAFGFDVMMALWNHWEAMDEHQATMRDLELDKDRLVRKINAHLARPKTARWETDHKRLEEELKSLDKMIAKERIDWKYKDLALMNDCAYALALLFSFCVLVSFFFPPAVITLQTMLYIAAAGAAACFICNTFYSGISGGLEIAKNRELNQLANQECDTLLVEFATANLPRKKQIFLELKRIAADNAYQNKLERYKIFKVTRSVLIDVLLPGIVFTTLLLMSSTGIGFGVAAGVIAFVAIVSQIVMSHLEPAAPDLPDYNEDEFLAFAKQPALSFFDAQTVVKQDVLESSEESSDFSTDDERSDEFSSPFY